MSHTPNTWALLHADEHLTRFAGALEGRFLPVAEVYVAGAVKFSVTDISTGARVVEDWATDLDNAKEAAEAAAKKFALRSSRGFAI